MVDSGRAEIVALTLGADGAVLATRERVLRLASPQVEARSAVGRRRRASWVPWSGRWPTAGTMDEAFAYGVAAGAATAMTPGTEHVPARRRRAAGIGGDRSAGEERSI